MQDINKPPTTKYETNPHNPDSRWNTPNSILQINSLVFHPARTFPSTSTPFTTHNHLPHSPLQVSLPRSAIHRWSPRAPSQVHRARYRCDRERQPRQPAPSSTGGQTSALPSVYLLCVALCEVAGGPRVPDRTEVFTSSHDLCCRILPA